MTIHHSAARLRVQAVLAGNAPMSGLSADERFVLNAQLDAEIELGMAHTDFGTVLDARGIRTVSLDESGRLVEHQADGTVVPVSG